MSLLLARLVAAAAVQGGQGVAKLEDLPQHVVGGEVEVDPGAEDLAEPLVLQHREPGVQPEHLPPELDLLAGRLALLDPSEHVPEAAPLFLPVLLTPGGPLGQLLPSATLRLPSPVTSVKWLQLA